MSSWKLYEDISERLENKRDYTDAGGIGNIFSLTPKTAW